MANTRGPQEDEESASGSMSSPDKLKTRATATSTSNSTCSPAWWLLIVVACVISASVAMYMFFGAESPTTALQEIEITDKPRNDARSYAAKELANGLQVMAVQDPNTLSASFALAVSAGFYEDPPELPGLMHFIEHMLFLGSAKYPEPDGYSMFISKHGGGDNAYTSDEETVYFLSLSESASAEALDRFADFFRAPLFDEQFVEKEVHAVDSEHAKNVQDPGRRVYEVMNSLADPSSPVGRFHTGNVETLYTGPKTSGTNPMKALRHHFAQHYCPARMHLAVFGSKPPQEQLRAAEEAFGRIPKAGALAGEGMPVCSKGRISHAEPAAWPQGRLHKWVDIKGTTKHASMWIAFQFPDLSESYAKQPFDYIDWVLSYKGTNSLFYVLRDTLGWAHGSGTSVDQTSAGTTLTLTLSLTDAGRNRPESVLDVVFAYLARLRRQGVDADLHQSIADAGALSWQWSPPASPVSTASGIAEKMTRLALKDVLWGDSVTRQVDHELAKSLLDLLSPANVRIGFIDPRDLERGKPRGSVPGPEETKELKYYGAIYAVRDLDDVFPGASSRWTTWAETEAGATTLEGELRRRLQDVSLPSDTVVLPEPPGPIQGLPQESDISLKLAATKDPEAAMTEDSTGVSASDRKFGFPPERVSEAKKMLGDAVIGTGLPDVWYRQGWRSNAPKYSPRMSMNVLFRPLQPANPPEYSAADSIRMSVYARCLREEIDTPLADLGPKGGGWGLGESLDGLSISFGGLPTALGETVKSVLDQYRTKLDEPTADKRFDRVVQDFRESLSSYSGMPVSYAIADRTLLLTKGAHSQADLLHELNQLTLDSTRHALRKLILAKPLHLTAFAMGNIDRVEALRIMKDTVDTVKNVPELSSNSVETPEQSDQLQVEKITPIVALAKPVELRKSNPRPGDPNDAVVVSIVAGVATVEKRVVLGLLGEMMRRVAFGELRTRMQLGYVVNAGQVQLSNVLGISCVVQGTAMKADDLEAAVQRVYFKIFPEYLESLSDEDFDARKRSFADGLLEKPFSTSTEVGHFWSTVEIGADCFHLQDEMLRYLPSVTKDLLREEWTRLVLPADKNVRAKLVIKYFGGDGGVPERPTMEESVKAWENQGVTVEGLDLLKREYSEALILHEANAKTRAEVLEQSGGKYFPADVTCHLASKQAPASTQAGSLAQNQMRQQKNQHVLMPIADRMLEQGSPLTQEHHSIDVNASIASAGSGGVIRRHGVHDVASS